MGSARPTNAAYVNYDGDTSQAVHDTWPPDERARELSACWKGEAHFELNATTETPRPAQMLRSPPGFVLQDYSPRLGSSSGRERDVATIGLRNA